MIFCILYPAPLHFFAYQVAYEFPLRARVQTWMVGPHIPTFQGQHARDYRCNIIYPP